MPEELNGFPDNKLSESEQTENISTANTLSQSGYAEIEREASNTADNKLTESKQTENISTANTLSQSGYAEIEREASNTADNKLTESKQTENNSIASVLSQSVHTENDLDESNPTVNKLSPTLEIVRQKTELAALGKRLMITYPCSLLIGYPVIYALAFLISVFGLNGFFNSEWGYLINFLLNDIFVRGSAIALCFFALKKYCTVKYKDTTTDFKPYEIALWLPVMIMLGVFGSYITNLITNAVQLLGGSGEIPEPLQSIRPEQPTMFILYLIFVGITGPILEEVIFRGIFLRALRPYGDMAAILVTAAMFGLYHLNFSQVLYTGFIGIVLAAVAVRSNSLIPPIILHIVNNFMVTFVKYSDIAMSGNEIPTAADSFIIVVNHGINAFLNATPTIALLAFLLLISLNKCRVSRTAHAAAGDEISEAAMTLTEKSKLLLLVKNKAAIFCAAVVLALIVYTNF